MRDIGVDLAPMGRLVRSLHRLPPNGILAIASLAGTAIQLAVVVLVAVGPVIVAEVVRSARHHEWVA